jgi:ferredoxin-NADP reductase
VLSDSALLASATTLHLALAFLRRHRNANRLVSPFVLPSFVFAVTPWLWGSDAALIWAAVTHILWFVACEVVAPRRVESLPASAPVRGGPRKAVAPRRQTSALPATSDSGFVQTHVLTVLDEAIDIKTFRLVRPAGFDFTPGQFVPVRVSVAGKPHVRCYSISSSPDSRAYLEISVRRQGLVSTTLHSTLRGGSLLSVGRPAGQFVYPQADDRPLALLAGGIGITPLLSMLRYAVSSDPTRPVALLYSARSLPAAAFLSELKLIAERHPQVRIGLTLSEGQAPAPWRSGHIDMTMLRPYVPHPAHTVFCICGPTPMMDAMERMLLAERVPPDQIRSEKFDTAIAATLLNPAASIEVGAAGARPTAGSRTFQVAFSASGRTAAAPPSQTLLETAEAEGIAIPSSCRSGVCQACRTLLCEGDADCRSTVLDAADRAAGFVLPCVTWPTTDCVLEA